MWSRTDILVGQSYRSILAGHMESAYMLSISANTQNNISKNRMHQKMLGVIYNHSISSEGYCFSAPLSFNSEQ